MRTKFNQINNLIFKRGFICIRTEEEVNSYDEVDILSRDEKKLNLLIKEMFFKGNLLDQLDFNKPHVKLSSFNNEGILEKEYDIVSNMYLFDNSRWFKIVRDCNNLSIKTSNIQGLDVTSLSIIDKYLLLLLHSIADKKTVSYKYFIELQSYRDLIKEEELKKVLSNYFINYSMFYRIENSFFSKKKIKTYRALLFMYLMFLQPKNFLIGIQKKFSRIFKVVLKKIFSFKVIVFMGADGSGKTTTIDELMHILGEENCYYAHLGNRSQFLPTTRLLKKSKGKKNRGVASKLSGEEKDVHSSAKRSLAIKSLIYNLNVFLEVFSHICWIYIKNVFILKKKYILLDRYIYDRYQLNESVFIYKLFPSPDFIVLLDASLDTLLDRKKEHPRSTLENFQKRYYTFLLKQHFSKTLRLNSENNLVDNINLINNLLKHGS